MRAGLRLGWGLAQVIKASEEELAFLAETDDLSEAAHQLWHADLRLLVLTRGKLGCRYVTPTLSGNVPGFAVEVVDTTGAGDGFVAGLLKGLIEHANAATDEMRLRTICRFANAVGALTTTQRGAIPALPTAAQIDEFLRAQSV